MENNERRTEILAAEDGKSYELAVIKGKKDVFISYRRPNAAYVQRLFNELEDNGIKAWFDMSELHLDVGKEYTERIHRGIDNSEFFLLMYTNSGKNSIEDSDFIINEELGYAVEKGKRILFYPQDPIDIASSRLRPYVEKIQWLDTEATAVFQTDTQETIVDEKRLVEISQLINERRGYSVFEDQSIFLIRIALQRKLGKITTFGNYSKLCGAGLNEFFDNEHLTLSVVNKGLFIPVPQRYKKELEELNFFRKDKVEEIEKHLAALLPDTKELKERLYRFMEENSHIYSMGIIYERLRNYLRSDRYKSIRLPSKETFDVESLIFVISEMVASTFVSDLRAKKTMFNGAELGVYSITDSRTINKETPCVDMELYYSDYFSFKCMTELYHVLCSINGAPFEVHGIGDIESIAPFLCSLGLGGFLAAYIDDGVSLMWTKRSGNISSGDMWHFSYDETVSLLLDSAKEGGHLVMDNDRRVKIDINNMLHRALKEEVGATGQMIEDENHGIFEIGIIKSERLEIELISHAVLHLDNTSTPQQQIKEMHDNANDGYLEISKIQFLPLEDKQPLIGRLLSPESYEIFTRMRTRIKKFVGKKVKIGSNTIVEKGCYVDDGASIGDYCKIHRNVYIGKNVKIGDNVKIQNNNSIYEGVELADGVFVGTNVSFINDRYPRAILQDGRRVDKGDWKLERIKVCYGASIGAGAVIMCGVTIGKWAMVGCGAVVLNDVPDYATVVGNPARVVRIERE